MRLPEEATSFPWYSTPICPSGKILSWLANCSFDQGSMPGKQRFCRATTPSQSVIRSGRTTMFFSNFLRLIFVILACLLKGFHDPFTYICAVESIGLFSRDAQRSGPLRVAAKQGHAPRRYY